MRHLLPPVIKKYYLEIIATIPFNLIFLGIDYLIFTRGLKVVQITRGLRYIKFLRLGRFFARLPRFLRLKDTFSKTKIRKFQPHEKSMKKSLSFKVILLITINSIMGTGIFFLTASGAKHAGPASLISWIVLSIISIYIAMCFSELTSMFPKAGGIYEFAKQTYGRFWSFVIGWATAIAGSVTISMLLLGALQYLIPQKYSMFYIPLAISLVIIFNYVAYKGMKTSTYVLVTFALITIGTILAVIIPGFITLEASNFNPFFVFPSTSILLAIFFIAETFFGWESAIFLSAETRNPGKVMPKALIYGTIVIALFSLSLALAGMGNIPWQQYGASDAPLKDLGMAIFGDSGKITFTVLVFISIIGASACWIVTAPRLLMALAEDKLFFVQFAKVHPKYKSPHVSIVFQAFLISFLVIIGSGSYETLLHILVPLILIIYSSVLLNVVILRFKKPGIQRPYKVPFGKIGPILVVIFLMLMLYLFIKETHSGMELLKISLFLIVMGIPAYLFIELFYKKEYVRMRKDFLGKIASHLNKLIFPEMLFRKIKSFIGPIDKTKIIMDHNSGVGDFTRRIIEDKMQFKKIYAIEKSNEDRKVFQKNIPKKLKNKIKISGNIPNKIPKIDILYSFNYLGYLDNMPTFIRKVKKILAKDGKFCFHIYHNIINTTPNANLIENGHIIKQIFHHAGLKVKYKKVNRIIYEHIFIYGKK
jgi:amino acid transporter